MNHGRSRKKFKANLLGSDVLNKDGVVRYEFHDGGGHGRKVRMNRIERVSDLYEEMTNWLNKPN